MPRKIELVLKEVIKKIEPNKEELKEIKDYINNFSNKLNKKMLSSKIRAEIFVGGSFAKQTLIKKDKYDIDLFLRFDKGYKDKNISGITKKLLAGFENLSVIHGSRDYFRITPKRNFFLEIIPVIKISKPKDADNVTDLSYSHVRYINKKINSDRLKKEVMVAKEFCYACNAYGAESYIRGFSGYSIELLIAYYKSFLKMIQNLSKSEGKLIIDIEKDYKNKNDIMININSSKTESPVILIDPTFKQRNALAALSQETFERFKKHCIGFLKNQSLEYFREKKSDLEKIKLNAKKKKFDFILIETKTGKQEGDIAGSKLLKFYNHLTNEISRYFEIKEKGFNYNGKKSARYFFVCKSKKTLILGGPFADDKKNIIQFIKEHKNIFEKNKRIYAREQINFGLKEFIEKWKIKNVKRMKEMAVKEMKIID